MREWTLPDGPGSSWVGADPEQWSAVEHDALGWQEKAASPTKQASTARWRLAWTSFIWRGAASRPGPWIPWPIRGLGHRSVLLGAAQARDGSHLLEGRPCDGSGPLGPAIECGAVLGDPQREAHRISPPQFAARKHPRDYSFPAIAGVSKGMIPPGQEDGRPRLVNPLHHHPAPRDAFLGGLPHAREGGEFGRKVQRRGSNSELRRPG